MVCCAACEIPDVSPKRNAKAAEQNILTKTPLGPKTRPTTRCPMVKCYAPLGFQKYFKPRNTLYTLPSEPQPDHKRV